MYQVVDKHVKRANKGLRGEMKGTKPRRKFERLRVKIRGSSSANGDDKMHEGERKI